MKQPFAVSYAARIAGAAVLLGVVLSANAAPPTTPSTVLFGGGATLPGVAYVGAANAHPEASSTAHRLTQGANDSDLASVFGNYTPFYQAVESANTAAQTVPTISYCQTGSGAGKKVLNGTSGFSANTFCPLFGGSTSSAAGFGGCVTDGAGQNCDGGNVAGGTTNPEGGSNQFGADPAFVASDAPLSSGEYSTFITNKSSTRTEPVQFPVIAGAIAVIYNNSSVASGTQLNFTDKDICLIYSGKVTNWNDTRLSFHSVVGTTSKNIVPVFRSDGSGTSFGFSNHLAAVCPSVDSADFGTTNHFDTSQGFNSAAGASNSPFVISGLTSDPTTVNASSCAAGTLPVNGTTSPVSCMAGRSGNSGVTAAVGGVCNDGSLCTVGARSGVDGAIGYAEAANAVNAEAVNGVVISYGKVNSFDPLVNFPGIFTKGSLVATDRVLSGLSSLGAPQTAAISPAPANPNCVWLVNPTTYAKPAGQYPIMAVSYLMANNTGNGADANNIARLLTALAVPNLQSSETGIGNNGSAPTGFAFLALTDSQGGAVDPVVFGQAVSHCVQP